MAIITSFIWFTPDGAKPDYLNGVNQALMDELALAILPVENVASRVDTLGITWAAYLATLCSPS